MIFLIKDENGKELFKTENIKLKDKMIEGYIKENLQYTVEELELIQE
jgi:hypothetical protein